MLVTHWMSKSLFTVDVNDTIQEAIIRLQANEISKLPVLERGSLVGIVTDRDVRRFWPSVADSSSDIKDLVYMAVHMTVGLIMTKDPITVTWSSSLQETAMVLLDNNISGCPVVNDEGKVVGMITKNDLFSAFISWTGVRTEGIQMGFLSEDRPGCICDIMNAVRNHHGRIASIMSSNQDAPPNFRHITVMTYNLEAEEVPEIRSELSGRAKMLFILDRLHNNREIFDETAPAIPP